MKCRSLDEGAAICRWAIPSLALPCRRSGKEQKTQKTCPIRWMGQVFVISYSSSDSSSSSMSNSSSSPQFGQSVEPSSSISSSIGDDLAAGRALDLVERLVAEVILVVVARNRPRNPRRPRLRRILVVQQILVDVVEILFDAVQLVGDRSRPRPPDPPHVSATSESMSMIAAISLPSFLSVSSFRPSIRPLR